MSTSPLDNDNRSGSSLDAVRIGAAGAIARVRRVQLLDVIWAGLALGAALGVSWLLLGWTVTVWASVAGVTIALMTRTFSSEHPLVRGVGGILAFPAGLFVLLSVGVATGVGASSPVGGAIVWFLVAAVGSVGFAVVLSVTTVESQDIKTAVSRAAVALGGAITVLVILIVPNLSAVDALRTAGQSVLAPVQAHLLGTTLEYAPVVVPVLLFLAAWTVRATLRRIPVDAMVSPRSRTRVVTALAHADRALLGVLAVAALAAGALPAVGATVGGEPTLSGLRTSLPTSLAGPVATILASQSLRVLLLGVLVTAGLITLGYRALLRARTVELADVGRAVIPPLACALTVIFAARWLNDAHLLQTALDAVAGTLGMEAAQALARLDPFILGAIGAVVVTVFGWAPLAALSVFARAALPGRVTIGALTSTAIFTFALVLTLVGHSLLALGVAALAIVIWDASEYAHTLRDELGVARTRRAELVHAGSGLGIGALAVGAAVGVSSVIQSTQIATGLSSLAALVLATVALVLLLYSL